MSLSQFPPVRGLSVNQHFYSWAGGDLDPSTLETWDFSPEFKVIYGEPTLTVHSWARLMRLASELPTNLMPTYTMNFIVFCHTQHLRAFRNDMDHLTRSSQLPKLGRPHMEAAYAKLLLNLFERDVERDVTQILSWNDPKYRTREEALEKRKECLEYALKERFDDDMEDYWVRHANTPGLDLTRVLDEHLVQRTNDDFPNDPPDVEGATEQIRNTHISEQEPSNKRRSAAGEDIEMKDAESDDDDDGLTQEQILAILAANIKAETEEERRRRGF